MACFPGKPGGHVDLFIQVWQEHRTRRQEKDHRIRGRKTKSAIMFHILLIHAFTDAALPVISNAAANCAGSFFAKTFSGVYKNGCDHNSHIKKN